MKKNKPVIWFLLSLTVIGLAFLIWQFQNDKANTRVTAVSVVKSVQMDLDSSIGVSGQVVANKEWSVYAPISGKYYTEVLVSKGQRVKQNQVLARLESKDLKDQLDVAKLQLEREREKLRQIKTYGTQTYDLALKNASEDLKRAQEEYEKQKTLYESGAVSNQVVIDANQALIKAQLAYEAASRDYNNYGKVSDVKIQNIAVSLANKEVNRLMTEMEKRTIKSPGEGIVYEVSIKTADLSVAETPAIKLITDQDLKVTAKISEFDAPKVEIGSVVSISNSGIESIYEGRVSYISPTAEKKQTGEASENVVAIEVTPNQAMKAFKANYTADLIIKAKTLKGVIAVPLETVYMQTEREAYVFVVKNNQLEKRKIDLGIASDQWAHVVSQNLSAGEILVVNPTKDLKEGMTVTTE